MCDLDMDFDDSKGAVVLVCNKTGKPITISNAFGMYCEDLCSIERDKQIAEDLTNFFQNLKGV